MTVIKEIVEKAFRHIVKEMGFDRTEKWRKIHF